MEDHVILGIDVGGTGIKGGLVDVSTGTMRSERLRFDTPAPATPEAMAGTVQMLVDHFQYQGVVGVGFPAIVRRGVASSASNIDDSWIGANIGEVFGQRTGLRFYALNDADAAGIATMKFGAGRQYAEDATVLMVTIGTGLGGALFLNGDLLPNLEIGQIYLRNQKVIAEQYISNKIRKDSGMSFKAFGKRFNKFLSHVDFVLNPDVIILGGGASKYFPEFKRHLKVNAILEQATLLNDAGTIGAAYHAARCARLEGVG
ncbi:ROK family protein [Neolewinella lacunae]|uniref:ROK family protein n=1 Tax=Neolewinella lacunae TaxID=1517758 RepID=A0A923PK03_9BACT|nr:ROK family protein [Neolewinella lacunae]MBC6994754.1 ROK family protein [Neolewinella lacunae]MDN3634376.1 ROK family protein [Neolewinella lacunae]